MKPILSTQISTKAKFLVIFFAFLAGATACTKSGISGGGDVKILTLQPAAAAGDNVSVYDPVPYNEDPSETTYVVTAPTQNFNGDTIMSVSNTGFESFYAANTLLRFNGVSVLPATATIISANLYLYGVDSITTNIYGVVNSPGQFGNTVGTDVSGDYFALQQLSASWGDDSVTWVDMPTAVTTNNVAIPPSVSRWDNNDTLDITGLVQSWQANPSQNYGIRLAAVSGLNARARQPFPGNFVQMQFYSSYAANPLVRPKLIVTYKQ